MSASGIDVGLPAGQMGNSEVGHLNLGAGRIVYQDLTRINKAIAEGDLPQNPVLQQAFAQAHAAAAAFARACSRMAGCTATWSISSPWRTLPAEAGVKDIMVHAITDGRDTSPTGGAAICSTWTRAFCEERREHRHGDRALLCHGPRPALERDKLAWDAIVLGRGEFSARGPPRRWPRGIHATGKTDEFLPPLIFSHAG